MSYSSSRLIASLANGIEPGDPFGLVTRETLLRSRGPQLAFSGRFPRMRIPFTQKEPRIYAFIRAALSQSGELAPAFHNAVAMPGQNRAPQDR